MHLARLAAGLTLLVAAVVCAPAGQAQAPAPALALAAASTETGWISLTLTGAPDGPVEIHERAGGRDRVVGQMALSAGTATLARGVAWRCDRRARHLTATRVLADGAPQSAAAAITTPSCAGRLQLIVAPARLRPGQSARLHVADTWNQGGISGRVCARSGAVAAACRTVRLRAGQTRLRTSLRLARAGRWTVTLRPASAKAALQRRVDVGPSTRYRVRVTGDSMVYGIIDVLGRSVRKTGGTLIGDPHPATGITKPFLLDWPAHARASARSERDDATVVFLGAVDAFPLRTAAGETADCCGPAWIAQYARRVRAMMTSYLGGGSSLVYWVLLPAARDPGRVPSTHAINTAIAQAAATFPDGVRIVDIGPAISPGDRYRTTAIYRGERAVIRDPDGIHLANAGVHIAARVILRALRHDGVAATLG
jgi:hypothetical protein